MKKEEPQDEIRRIVRNWWTAWMEDDKVQNRFKCFNLLGSEKFQVVVKKVLLEEVSSDCCSTLIPAIKKLVNDFEGFVSSSEAQLAAQKGIINCLKNKDGRINKIERIKQSQIFFDIPENFISSSEVKQAAEVAVANSLFYNQGGELNCIDNFFFPHDYFFVSRIGFRKRHVYGYDVQQAAQKWILDRLEKQDITSARIASVIKNHAKRFGVPDTFFISECFGLAIKEYILKFLYSYEKISVDDLIRCGYVTFTDGATGVALGVIKKEFGVVEKIICSIEVQQAMRERELAIKVISIKLDKEMKRIYERMKNEPQCPF